MEDLYKDNLNSWLRQTRFSKTVYRQPDPSQIPFISIAELKLASSKTNKNQAATGIMSTLKLNPDSSLTGEVQEVPDSEANKTEPVSKNSAKSVMLKNVKGTVTREVVGPPSKQGAEAKTVKSSSRPKKGFRWLQKYLDCGVCRVSALEKYSEVH